MSLVFDFFTYFWLLALLELKRSVTLLRTINGTQDILNFSQSVNENQHVIGHIMGLWVPGVLSLTANGLFEVQYTSERK